MRILWLANSAEPAEGRAALLAALATEHEVRVVADAPPTVVAHLLRPSAVDAVHVEGPALLAHIPLHWRRPVLLDLGMVRWAALRQSAHVARAPMERWQLRQQSRRMRVVEAAATRRSTVTLVASEASRAALELAVGAPWPVHVVPRGPDLARLEPLRRLGRPDRQLLVLPGPFSTPLECARAEVFLREILPRVRAHAPQVRCRILGAPLHLRWLARRTPGVELAEDGPPATRWRDAGVAVALADASGGDRVRALEALALGIPTVLTAAACIELGLHAPAHVLAGGTPRSLADALCTLVRDPDGAEVRAQAARAHVIRHYGPEAVRDALAAAYTHALRRDHPCALCS